MSALPVHRSIITSFWRSSWLHHRRWRLLRVAAAALWVCALSVHAAGPDVEQVRDFQFREPGIDMWRGEFGGGVSLDETWDLTTTFSDSGNIDATVPGVPSTGVTFDYDFDAKFGLEGNLTINSGSISLEYPVRVKGTLPSTVMRNEVFDLKIENEPITGLLNDPMYRMEVTTPQARFTLDAILEASVEIGPGQVSAAGYEVASFDSFTIGIPEDYNRVSLVDVGSGSSSIDIPAGPYGTITLAVPEGVSQTVTTPTANPPQPLPKLVFNYVSETKFLNMNVDLDALVQAALGVPGDVLEGEYVLFGDGDADDKKQPPPAQGDPPPDDGDNSDGSPDLSLQYKLLDVAANLGLKLAQEIVFQPTIFYLGYTDLNGEVDQAHLGDTLGFRAPNYNGTYEIPVYPVIYGELTNRMGFVVNGDITVQALQLALKNEFGIDFELNLAELLGFDSEYLIDEQIPEGGLSSAPLYLYEETFNVSNLLLSNPFGNTKFTTQVVPETSTLLLSGFGTLVAGFLAWRRRRAS